MRPTRSALGLLLVLGTVVACGIAGCDGDENATPAPPGSDGGAEGSVTPGDGSTNNDGNVQTDAQADTNTGPQEFTAYVKDLIENQTSSTSAPDDFTTKTFVDSEDPNAFPASFFP